MDCYPCKATGIRCPGCILQEYFNESNVELLLGMRELCGGLNALQAKLASMDAEAAANWISDFSLHSDKGGEGKVLTDVDVEGRVVPDAEGRVVSVVEGKLVPDADAVGRVVSVVEGKLVPDAEVELTTDSFWSSRCFLQSSGDPEDDDSDRIGEGKLTVRKSNTISVGKAGRTLSVFDDLRAQLLIVRAVTDDSLPTETARARVDAALEAARAVVVEAQVEVARLVKLLALLDTTEYLVKKAQEKADVAQVRIAVAEARNNED